MYYDNKKPLLQEIFGVASVTVGPDSLPVDGKVWPTVADVIICLDPRGLARIAPGAAPARRPAASWQRRSPMLSIYRWWLSDPC